MNVTDKMREARPMLWIREEEVHGCARKEV